MCKRTLCLLALVLLLSAILSGCSGPTPPPTLEPTKAIPPAPTVAPTQAPKAAEPTKAPAATQVVAPTTAPTQAPQVVAPTKGIEPKRGGILVYGLVGDPPALDPHTQKGAADATVKNMVYSALFTRDRNNNIVPLLAEKYERADPTTVVITLRKGVKFHNGDELTSDDVKFSYERMQDPKVGSNMAGMLAGIKFDTPDKYTIKLTLPKPDATLLYTLARTDALIANKNFVQGGANLNQVMMGTGPFKFKGRQPNVSFEVTRFDDYFLKPLPYLDGIKFIPYADETAKATAIQTGDVDFIDSVPFQNQTAIEALANQGKLKYYSDRDSIFMLFYMNPSVAPFDNKQVRQALAWAIDRDAVGKAVFFGRGKTITGAFLPPTFLGYDKSLEGTYGYDPAKAKQLLAQAGWTDDNKDGVLEAHNVKGVKDGAPFKINILATNAYAMHYRMAELMQANLKDIGIDGTVELVDWPTRVQRRLDVKPWEIQADGHQPYVADPAFMEDYFSVNGVWSKRTHFADPALSDLLDKARSTYDSNERARLYAQVDKQALEQSYYIYVWRREQAEATQTYVMNYAHTFSIESFFTLPEVWLNK